LRRARDLLNNVLAQPQQAKSRLQSSLPAATREPQEIIIKLDPAAIAGPDTRRIPHELPPAAEEFFGRQTELKELIDASVKARTPAVVGPAGLGKTALAAQALEAVLGRTRRSFADSPFPDGVVFLDLVHVRGQAEPAWNTLAQQARRGRVSGAFARSRTAPPRPAGRAAYW